MQVLSLWGSIVGEIHVLLAALIMFVLLPLWAVAGRRSIGLQASVLALGVSFWVAVVTGLAYISSVRYSLIFVVALLGVVAGPRLLPRIEPREPIPDPLRIWDIFERPRFAAVHVARSLRASAAAHWSRFREHYGLFGIVLSLSALLWALVYGSWPWLHQVGPGTADGYTNLLRIASLASNSGVYSSGSAPTGVSALGAALSTAFFLPPLNVLRFLYPLADMFTVLAAGVLAHQLTRSGRASALVMFMVSVSALAHVGFPVNFESPLAMHWADILVLLAWAESVAWLTSQGRSHAFFAGWCLLGASLTSPPEAAIGLAVIAILTLGRGWVVVRWATLGALVGLIPLAIGILGGHPLSPDGWLQSGFPAIAPIWTSPQSSPYWLPWAAVALAAINLVRSDAAPLRRIFSIAVGAAGLAAALLGWNAAAASIILWSGLLGLMVLVSAVDTLLVLEPGQMRFGRGADLALAGLAILGIFFPSQAPALLQFAPAKAASTTLKIEQSLPPYEWTIVSPVDQYSEVLSRGWHEELSLFVQTYPLADAQSRRYKLKNDAHAPILTQNVFLFVEPRLFPGGARVTRSEMSLPISAGTAAYAGKSLAGVESRAYFWALAYHKSHPETSAVYMRGRDLMVLWIRQ